MKPVAFAAAVLTVWFFSGCASTQEAANVKGSTYEEPVVRTGTNIPARGKAAMTEEEKASRAEEAQKALEKLRSTAPGNPLK